MRSVHGEGKGQRDRGEERGTKEAFVRWYHKHSMVEKSQAS